MLNKDNIKFIPKLDDLKFITNWKSITLLNISYYGQSFSPQSLASFPMIIQLEKIGFVKGRYILDNVINI